MLPAWMELNTIYFFKEENKKLENLKPDGVINLNEILSIQQHDIKNECDNLLFQGLSGIKDSISKGLNVIGQIT